MPASLLSHNAPPVHYPVGGSRLAGAAHAVFAALGACVLAAWCIVAAVVDWRQGVTALAWVAACCWGGHAMRSAASGELSWDGMAWQWAGAPPRQDVALGVHLDFQRALLVSLRDGRGPVLWLWLERRACPERWDMLRRAVYSRARMGAAPNAAHQDREPMDRVVSTPP
ncbi:hypothetical protein PY257_04030 [Ramlibacter sp. H39-3-26]|uniref:hypothetical protein n=1 Tax=Curvibacter soli TaxID=3031331 RepID=UPI0023DA72C9|nr:hypothetical protein [Ramlibacter sp. H39-3-26]MDF1484355.1 hypothetical protein [Ramlibacter sp. H39-3-26]